MEAGAHVIIILIICTSLQITVDSSFPSLDVHVSQKYDPDWNNRSTVGEPSGKTPRQISVKKWQVGRVSRKHYEIVNMLWRKTKYFNDEGTIPTSTAAMKMRRSNPSLLTVKKKVPLLFTPVSPSSQASTPSYIEFYYLDDNDARIKQRDIPNPNDNARKLRVRSTPNDLNLKQERYPVLSFYVNEPQFKFVAPPAQANNPNSYDRKRLRSKTFYDKHSMYEFIRKKLKYNNEIGKNTSVSSVNLTSPSTKVTFDDETCPATFESNDDNITSFVSRNYNHKDETTASTTKFYDKIKFFEKYDQHTQAPRDDNDFYDEDAENKGNHIDSNQRVVLEDVNINIGHHDGLNQKLVKKHADNDLEEKRVTEPKNNISNDNTTLIKQYTEKDKILLKNNTSSNHKIANKISNSTAARKSLLNFFSQAAKNASRPAPWANYPFAAVYVYEPSQLHCDAAALSSHWLVAAGSCLSRYRREHEMVDRRSAFVAYCGENWWHPERVAYVKYVVVHPRYHHMEETRKYLYNIGLIQVVESMESACVGWRPITLISHHFAANSEGSPVAAVGWGLDRYDASYFQRYGPRPPLSVYKSLAYSLSCPGNTGYSKMKSKREEEALKNIYCLLLPPYNGEEDDPIHGSVLLVGGKLIALYLQEERHPLGEQSAQYTGVWRLLPWVLEIAREPEDSDSFGIDI